LAHNGVNCLPTVQHPLAVFWRGSTSNTKFGISNLLQTVSFPSGRWFQLGSTAVAVGILDMFPPWQYLLFILPCPYSSTSEMALPVVLWRKNSMPGL
jgi:hypothetical protein